jgi:hypothetical protein
VTATDDVLELRQRVRELDEELRATQAANLAHRQALGWLLGHHRTEVREAASSALARYGAEAEPFTPRMAMAAVATFVRHGWRRRT